ncbi:MAG TPA: aminotransferase class I/II-fold pyridoxal phosphate-dependent enzyme, partial [Dokdonella sp.]|uniref:aminotransferase class I/II-fold pyridoxal phosphate-dependent enzyme n=1 Tax=Dokdonella sp. TaxID=2291710 RepID=UPI002C2274D5
MTSLFAAVELAPRDPILGLTEQFNADTRSNKVNLGVGVYYNDEGRIPLLKAVRKAEQARIDAAAARGYLPIEGLPGYNRAVQELLLGADSPLIAAGRVLTAQSLGGTGALKIGADFLKRLVPQAKVAISDPSWENHRALFEYAGFEVVNYPYYDAATHGVNFAGMIAALESYPAGTVVVLHACCHNPTGVDLTADQWTKVVEVVKARRLIPFLDIAYQGFGDGIAAYDNAVKVLVFGADSEPVTSGRVATIQAIGGTGGLKVGADFLKKLNPAAKVLISDPSWENHRALFTNAGFEVESYPYYDAAKRGIDFDGMLAALNAAPAGTVVVLHACCHNPTG